MKKKVAVIGGGVFGVTVATYLAKNNQVDLYEKEDDILKAASGINQYRAHRGYHYPRSEETIKTCLAGEKSFRKEYAKAMIDDVDQYYCIAKKDSLTDAKHFLQVCDKFGLSYQETKLDLVDDDKISLCFRVEESLIDPQILKKICLKKLEKSGVNLLLNTKATKESLENYDKVVICAYANTNELIADYPESQNDYQFELCEKIVVELPDSFKNKSAVVLDGPFMCVDPYGSSGKFLLGNVVHAIHSTNVGKMPVISEQYKKLLNNGVIKNPPITKFDEFIAAGKYFFPEMEKARHVGSMFTFRTVLPYKDKTDERPTLVRQVSDKIFTIYSGKIISCVTAARQIQKLIG